MNKWLIMSAGLFLLETQCIAPPAEVPKNCHPSIVEQVRKLESFDIKCREGYVADFCLSDSKRPFPDFEFFSSNVEVFGLKREDIFDCNKHPCQQWKGVPISPGLGFSPHMRPPDYKIKCMSVHTIDTHSWNLDTKPTISSAAATALALKLWKDHAPAGRFSLDMAPQLEIFTHRGSPPQLIWSINGIWHKKDAGYRVMCSVDAHSLKSISAEGCSVGPYGETL